MELILRRIIIDRIFIRYLKNIFLIHAYIINFNKT